jgi:hypothetical protein
MFFDALIRARVSSGIFVLQNLRYISDIVKSSQVIGHCSLLTVLGRDTQEQADWLHQQPAQIALVVSQMYMATGVERCMASKDPHASLVAYARQCASQLSRFAAMVRGPLPSLLRRSLATLITMDVHSRDLVDSLIRQRVYSPTQFEWQMQLRYAWHDAADDIVIRQVCHTSRLVGLRIELTWK